MAELLDPEGCYFGGRVIAQGVPEAGDDGAPQQLVFKRLLQVRAYGWWPKPIQVVHCTAHQQHRRTVTGSVEQFARQQSDVKPLLHALDSAPCILRLRACRLGLRTTIAADSALSYYRLPFCFLLPL